MKIASITEIGSHFNAYVEASEAGPVVVTREGKPVAVLVGIDDEDEVERLLMAYSPRLRSILDKSWQSIQEGRGIPSDEFWKRRGAQEPRKRRKAKKKPPSSKGDSD